MSKSSLPISIHIENTPECIKDAIYNGLKAAGVEEPLLTEATTMATYTAEDFIAGKITVSDLRHMGFGPHWASCLGVRLVRDESPKSEAA